MVVELLIKINKHAFLSKAGPTAAPSDE